MYIAGIHLSNNHLTEGIVTSSVIAVIATQLIVGRKGLKEADEKGGPIKSMPTTLIGKLVTPIHAAAIVIPAVAYLTIVPLSGGLQPEIISRFSLPKFDLGETAINVLRLVGCAGLAATYKLFSASRSVLGQSFHHIGVSPHRSFHYSLVTLSIRSLKQVREKPKIVSTGPYAVIRHPLYTYAKFPMPHKSDYLLLILKDVHWRNNLLSPSRLGTTSHWSHFSWLLPRS